MAFDYSANRRSFLKYGAGAATVATLGLAGCTSGDDGDGDGDGDGGDIGEVRVTQGQFIDSPDPNDHINSPAYNILDHVYEPLFTITPDIEIQPGVVDDWEAGDGSTDLMLRDDVVYHNGDDLVAADVVYTFRRMLDPEVGPESDQAEGLGAITEVEEIDDTTVRVHHPNAVPQLAEFQFGNFARAIKESWVEGQDTEEGAVIGDSADAFNGTGPYEVVEYTPDESIVMERFDDYWGEQPAVEELTFTQNTESSGRANALIEDETDLIVNVNPSDVSRVQDNDGTEIRNETSLRSIFLVMKNQIPPFDSQEFRQAMNYAVDNQQIIENVLGGFGEPMSQMHAEGVFGYNPDLEPYPQDLDQAESLVEESGYAGESIEIQVPDGRYLNDVSVGETAADQIDQLSNVTCEANIRDFGTLVNDHLVGGPAAGSGLVLIGWGVITADADYAMDAWINPESGLQTFQDEEAFSMLEDSRTESDTDAREQIFQDLNAHLRDQAPFVFLHSQDSIYGIDDSITWSPRVDETVWAWEME